MGGRLELKDASLYLNDLPAGVDNANGVVTFDRNRANIESLTAEVGGGRVGFGGFIGFANGLLLYRVQGTADQVRIRQEGISVTSNAFMNLTGTSENGLISGTVTVLRASFAPRADLGGLLAANTKPLPAPAAPNEYLRGLNFDVRIESGPSLEVQTSLTRDVQAEAEMRLRGNAARPVLLGDISVSQGEVQFFGNKYTINRGDIRFLNPDQNRAGIRRRPGNESARNHGEHQLLGYTEQAEPHLPVGPAAADQRHHRAARRGARSDDFGVRERPIAIEPAAERREYARRRPSQRPFRAGCSAFSASAG